MKSVCILEVGWPINGMVLLMLELNNAVCQVASSVDNVDLRVSWMQL